MTTDREEQEERRATVQNDARVARDTMHGRTIAEQNTISGRWAAEAKTTVIGASPIEYPPQPENSPWHHDPVGPEPPIDATDCGPTFGIALGEPHELKASAQDDPPSEPSHLSGAQGVTGDPIATPSTKPPPGLASRRVGSPPFRRRSK